MSTDLSREDRKVLQGWGVFVKELLYKASRDGCSPAAFHQKCDNQGPTLTLLHNTSGYVFGGCTFQSWTSAGGYVNDNKAFLFRLKEKGNPAPVKFPISQYPNYAIYGDPSYGPTFGGGNDLIVCMNQTFTKVNNSYFQLNGSCNIGHSYDRAGLDATGFMGSNFSMTEIQVFKIEDYHGQMDNSELEKPWRAVPEEPLETLRKWVLDYKPAEEDKVKTANLLLMGPGGSGKSSFFNTVNSIFRGHVTAKANSGSSEHSLTTKFRAYQVRDPISMSVLKFRLCDTMGLEEGQGIHPDDLSAVLKGHVQDGYQFKPMVPINKRSPEYRKNPTISDVIHCILFVIDSLLLEVFPEMILAKIRGIRDMANHLNIPQAVLLTKVDRLCPLVEEAAAKAMLSPTVEETVEKAAKLVGLPRGRVLPVRNYEKELELDAELDKMALTALRVALRLADDNIENRLEEERKGEGRKGWWEWGWGWLRLWW